MNERTPITLSKGKNDVRRKCQDCGEYFVVNKYDSRQFCKRCDNLRYERAIHETVKEDKEKRNGT